MANKVPPVGIETVVMKLKKEESDGSIEPSLNIIDSQIEGNWAKQDTIHILRSSMKLYNSDMIDNYAHEVSHGFTMVESEVFLEKTRIRNTAEMSAKLDALHLATVDTGFFNMYLGSMLVISN